MTYKLPGIAIGLAAIGVIAQACRYIALAYMTEASLFQITIRVLIPSIAGLIAYLAVVFFNSFIANQFHLLRLVTGLTILTIVYLAITIVVDRKFGFGITDFLVAKYPKIGKMIPYLARKPRTAIPQP